MQVASQSDFPFPFLPSLVFCGNLTSHCHSGPTVLSILDVQCLYADDHVGAISWYLRLTALEVGIDDTRINMPSNLYLR